MPALSQDAPAPELGCVSPKVTELAVPVIDRPAYFTSSGGRVRIVVSDLPDATHPTRPSTSRHEVVVGLGAQSWPSSRPGNGGSWLRSGRITLETCPGTNLTDVRSAEPDGREVFGVPSDAPTDGQEAEAPEEGPGAGG